MAKGRKYEKRKRRYRNFFIFYIAIVVFIFSQYTFSRYTETTSFEPELSVAKFNVKVNDQIIGVNDRFTLQLNPTVSGTNTNAKNNKLVPNSERCFDIIIDPSGTEVSLEYEFKFELTNSNIKLTKYSLDDGKTFITNIENNIIKGDILIQDKAFTQDNKVTIKAYLKWEQSEDIINPEISDSNISINSIIRQKIN